MVSEGSRDRVRVIRIISVLRDCWFSTLSFFSPIPLIRVAVFSPEQKARVFCQRGELGRHFGRRGLVPVEGVAGTAGEAPGLAETLGEARGGRWDRPLVPILGSLLLCLLGQPPPLRPQPVLCSFADNIVYRDVRVTPFCFKRVRASHCSPGTDKSPPPGPASTALPPGWGRLSAGVPSWVT